MSNHLETWRCDQCGETIAEPDTPTAHDIRKGHDRPVADRLRFNQSDRWHAVNLGESGVDVVYSEQLCCYCARPTRPDAKRLRTARTNDGEWWLVGPGVDMTAPEWRDFQRQLDGTFRPTLLPIGPDCLRQHPEWRFAVADRSAP